VLSHRSTRHQFSTQTYLFGLVAAAVIPVLAFAAFLLTRYAVAERARFESDAVQIARQVALVVDGELEGLVALLKGLATSSALARNDLATFRPHGDSGSSAGGLQMIGRLPARYNYN